MSISYPTSIDNFTNNVDNVDTIVAQDVNDLNDAVEALEAKVGIDNSAVSSSLDYKLKNTTSGHDHDGADSKKVITTNLNVTGLTASQLLRVNSGGTAIESSGKTVPTGSIVGTTDTQTLTNKTLTSPKINEDVAITSTSTEINALDGQMAAWTAFLPTWTNLSRGSGGNDSSYVKIGKTVHFRITQSFAANTSVSGAVSVALPVTAISYGLTVDGAIGIVDYLDSNTNAHYSGVILRSGTIAFYNAGATYATLAGMSATVPVAYATNDILTITGTYEAA